LSPLSGELVKIHKIIILLFLLLLRLSLLESVGLNFPVGTSEALLCSVSAPQVNIVPLLEALQLQGS
jgi:hypothetical protein